MSQLKILDAIQTRSVSMIRIFRGIRTNSILRDAKTTNATSSSSSSSSGGNTQVPNSHSHRPSTWEKRILVWTKKFPNQEAIPERVSTDTVQSAMTSGRIRVANYMMVVIALLCGYVIISGKLASKQAQLDAGVEFNDYRQQITAEYRASLNKNELAEGSKK